MTDLGPIIQGGALALLAIVLGWLGKIARESIRSSQRSAAEREAKLHQLISDAQKDASEARRAAMQVRADDDEAHREMWSRTMQSNTAAMEHMSAAAHNMSDSVRELRDALANRPCLETGRYENPDRRRLG